MSYQVIADKIRGMAFRHMDSMLGEQVSEIALALLTYKSMSARYLDAFADSLNRDRVTWHDLQALKCSEPQEYAAVETGLRNSKLGFTVSPENLLESLAQKAREGAPMGTLLKTAFLQIENDSRQECLLRVFTSLCTDASQRHDGGGVGALVAGMDDILTSNGVDLSALSQVGDHLLAGLDKSAGLSLFSRCVPVQVSHLLAGIVTPPVGHTLSRVLDNACGLGGPLQAVLDVCASAIPDVLYGQDANPYSRNITRLNLLLHGISPADLRISTSSVSGEVTCENAYREKFDAVISVPPTTPKLSALHGSDERFREYGYRPSPCSTDFAFVLDGLYRLNHGGILAMCLMHGFTFRGGVDAKVRRSLVEKNQVDAVIALPYNIFKQTGAPYSILVLRKDRPENQDILIINAQEHFRPERHTRILLPGLVERIVAAYHAREEIPDFSRRVSSDEIKERDYVLNAPLYLAAGNPADEELGSPSPCP